MSGNEMNLPEAGDNEETAVSGIDPVLPLLTHLLAEKQTPHRLVLSTGGLVISGQVVSLEAWLRSIDDLEVDLQALLEQATEANQAQTSESPRLVYLRERLRWGSGLTPAQAKEMQAEEASFASRNYFLHLVAVTLESEGQAIHLPRWRLPFNRVDGFALLRPAGEKTKL